MRSTLLFVCLTAITFCANAQKTLLVEQFTSNTSTPCYNVNPTFDALLQSNSEKVIVIKYHMYWPGTGSVPFYAYNSTENDARRNYYQVNSIPTQITNGNQSTGHPNQYNQNLINSLYNQSSQLSIELENVTLDTPTFSLDVIIHADTNLPSHSLRFVVAEELIQYSTAPGSNGETTFRWVMRDMVPNHNGYSKSALTANDTSVTSISFAYDEANLDAEDLALIAFVQRDDTKEVLGVAKWSLNEIYTPCAGDAQELCLATIDSLGVFNRVVWEKPVEGGFGTYLINRETTTTGVYELIGEVSNSNLSIFTDSSANPAQQSYRYGIQAVDTCGDTTELSTVHQTLHLQVSEATSGDHNLFWNGYQGNFTPSTYRIYRNIGLGWTLIDSISASQTFYTALSPPLGLNYYQIEVVHPNGCSPTLRSNEINSSRSNPFKIGTPNAVNQISPTSFDVSPNPVLSNSDLKISSHWPIDAVSIFSIDGSLVVKENFQNERLIQLNMSGISRGAYFMSIESSGNIVAKKLIVE